MPLSSSPNTSGIRIDGNSNFNFDGPVRVNNNANYGLLLTENSYAFFNDEATFQRTNRSQDSDPIYGVRIEQDSSVFFNKKLTIRNIGFRDAPGKGVGISIQDSHKAIFNGPTYINISSKDAKRLANTSALEIYNSYVSFENTLTTNNQYQHILIKDNANAFFRDITMYNKPSLRIPSQGLIVSGTNIAIFDGPITASNLTKEAISISGNMGKVNFVNTIEIINSAIGINLEDNANPNFENTISIVKKNRNAVTNKGIVANAASSATFQSDITIHGMSETAVESNDSSPSFYQQLIINDSDNGIIINGGEPRFNIVTIDNPSRINNNIGIQLNHTSSTFEGSVTSNNNSNGIKITDGSKSTFNGTVDTSYNTGGGNESNAYGILIANSNASFNSEVKAIDNSNSRNSDFNSTTNNIFITQNSNVTFNGPVLTAGNASEEYQHNEGMRVDHASNLTSYASISSSNHQEAIVINDSSNANFYGPIEINDSRNFSRLSEGIRVNNASNANYYNKIKIQNLTQSAINVNYGSVVTFQDEVTAINNESGIFVNNGSAYFASQPVLNANRYGININGSDSIIKFGTDLVITNNILAGIFISNGADITLPNNITISAEPNVYNSKGIVLIILVQISVEKFNLT
jgi:hypothetical protein